MATLSEQAAQAVRELEQAEAALSAPEVLADPKKIRVANQAYSRAKELAEAGTRFLDLEQACKDAREAVGSGDPEMQAMGEAELARLEPELAIARETLEVLLVPPDPHDGNDVIIEIRAGTGGDEASLFAGDLVRMYLRYAERRKWKTLLISESVNEVGGYKEAILGVQGQGAYGALKYESGVHRVQRIPSTEKHGVS